ncbi:MAG TPA: DUF1848 domain-containing protein [Clostridia bacterium]|nr:DUF1848 domain-containing protein [Clostridia bacterium]
MIISASRRTDIPAFYSDWFFNRVKEGFAMVRNPMNPHQVSRISLDRASVDGIVFWTKNPENMLPKLDLIKDYPYYFQFTLNPYDISLEPRVPRKAAVIATFKRLSDIIGPQRIIWRYDPILLNGAVDIEYHEKYFGVLAKKLEGYTSKCVISFIDSYKKADEAFKAKGITELDDEAKRLISQKNLCYCSRIRTCS